MPIQRLPLSDLLNLILKKAAMRRADKLELSSLSDVRMSEDAKKLHYTFFKLKEQFGDQLPELKKLHFITAGAFPYSPDLNMALEQLQQSGSISRENPSFEKFSAKEYSDTRQVIEQEWSEVTAGDKGRAAALEAAVDRVDRDLVVV
jgi:hypothetical protein